MNLADNRNYTEFLITKKEEVAPKYYFVKVKQEYIFGNTEMFSAHFVFEGKDDQVFYDSYINDGYRDYIRFDYILNGKKNVLRLYNLLDWTIYNKSRILFFIDKDYDNYIGIDNKMDRNIFVTTPYSIENYICTDISLAKILKKIYKIQSESIVEYVLEKYRECHSNFEKLMLIITSTILIYKVDEINHIILDDLDCSAYYKIIDLEFFHKKFLKEPLYNNMLKDHSVSKRKKQLILNIKKKALFTKTGCDLALIRYPKILNNYRMLQKETINLKWIRGKYQLKFFIYFLQSLTSERMRAVINSKIETENKNRHSFEKYTNINTAIKLEETTIFDIVSDKIDKQPDIASFFKENLKAI